MKEKLVLFDLDGTLAWTDGAGRAAVHEALELEMGTAGPIADFPFAGKTDTEIIRGLLRAAGHPEAESLAHVERVCERYTQLLESALLSGERTISVFVGVHELLASLASRDDALLGLLTGNVERGAMLKLNAAGIDPAQFRVGAFGSDAPDRADLPPIAVERAQALMGRTPREEDVVIIGDTPADVTCGIGIRARAIAVATGPFGVAELQAAGAYAVFEDLSDTEAVINAIFA